MIDSSARLLHAWISPIAGLEAQHCPWKPRIRVKEKPRDMGVKDHLRGLKSGQGW
jgi:hypothetical protein